MRCGGDCFNNVPAGMKCLRNRHHVVIIRCIQVRSSEDGILVIVHRRYIPVYRSAKCGIVLYCIALHCTALHCTAPHRTAPHRTALHCMLRYTYHKRRVWSLHLPHAPRVWSLTYTDHMRFVCDRYTYHMRFVCVRYTYHMRCVWLLHLPQAPCVVVTPTTSAACGRTRAG